MANPNDLTEQTHGIIDDSEGDTPPIRPKDSPLVDATPVKISLQDGGSALDALAAGVTPEGTDGVETPEEIAAREKKEVDDAAAVEKKKTDDAANAGKTPEQIAADKKVADDAAAAEAANKPKDKLDDITLPPHAKPATTESFNRVKEIARQELAASRAEVEELKKKIPAEGVQAITPELKKELDELRNFRAVHDYQNNPEFKKTYDEPVVQNNELILSKLKTAGLTDDHIAKIKEIGIDKLDWEPVLEKLAPAVRRSIEAKLLENENLRDKKVQAVQEAAKAPELLTKKQKDEQESRKQQDETTVRATIDSILEKVDWAKPKAIPAAATAEQKAAIEAGNKFAADQQARLKEILADRSPGMFGTLAASTLLAYKYKEDAIAFKAKFEAADAELKRIVKSSSTSRRKSGLETPIIPRPVSIFKSGNEALDELAKSVSDANA